MTVMQLVKRIGNLDVSRAATAIVALALTLSFGLTGAAHSRDTVGTATSPNKIEEFWTWSPDGGKGRPARSDGGGQSSGEGHHNKGKYAGKPRKKGNYTSTIVDPFQADEKKGVFKTINGAIAHTAVGGTVFIRPGTYVESVRIDYGVRLHGDVRFGLDLPESERVIIAPPAGAPCIYVDSLEAVYMRSLTLRTAGGLPSAPCLQLMHGDLTLQDSSVQGNEEAPAIYLAGGTAEIDSNIISGARFGVFVGPRPLGYGQASAYRLVRNQIWGNALGLSIDAQVPVRVEANNFYENREAAVVVAKGTALIEANDLSTNYQDALVVLYPDDLTVRANRIYANGRYGIYMPLSKRGRISGNDIKCNLGGGIEPDEDVFPGNDVAYNPPPEPKKKSWWSDEEPENPCEEFGSPPSAGGYGGYGDTYEKADEDYVN